MHAWREASSATSRRTVNLHGAFAGMSVALPVPMINGLNVPIPAIPWLAAILLGATAHVGWLTHDCAAARVTVPTPPPRIVVAASPRPASDAPPTVVVQPRAATRAKAKSPLPYLNVLRCTAERDCSISRAELDRYLEQPAKLAKQARIVPAMEDGRHVGFKIYGVRRWSIPGELGLHNGDLLESVNGHPLASVDDAMSAYVEFSDTTGPTVVRFGLKRKGEPIEVVLRIQENAACSRPAGPTD